MGPNLALTATRRCVFVETPSRGLDEEASSRLLAEIQQVYQENKELLDLLGLDEEPGRLAASLMSGSALPPGGQHSYVLNGLLTERESGEAMGVVGLYRGYPKTDALYISSLFLRPKWQGQGLGAEIAEHLKEIAVRAGYRTLYAGVGIKNWPALRFWLAMGFSRLTKISGDAVFAETNFACIEMVHDLNTS